MQTNSVDLGVWHAPSSGELVSGPFYQASLGIAREMADGVHLKSCRK